MIDVIDKPAIDPPLCRSRPRATRAVLRTLTFAFGATLPMVVQGQAFAAVEPDLGSIGSTTRIAVIGITIVLLIAAGLAAHSAIRRPTDGGPLTEDDLLEVDLLGLKDRRTDESRATRVFESVFLLVLLGYAVGDRGFAWFHVPGTPLFVGELTLALGVFAMLSSRVPTFSAFRVSPAFRILAFWMVWGLVFLALQVPTYGFDAIRDSAIWYYGFVAILTVFLMMSDPGRFGRWSRLFVKAIPFLLLWFPVAMVLDYLLGDSPPYAPDSQVPLFDHRHFNMAVLSAMALGFMWLVERPTGQLTATQRMAYSAGATVVVLVAGFQTRGGFAAAVIGILLVLMFIRGRRAELALVGGAVVVALATIAIVGNISIPISNGREISAAQMIDNLGSIVNPDSGESRQRGTTQWRLELWTAVLDDVITDHPVAGFGPGPNLGERYGVETNSDVPLRNPHNSHLGVLSRMGLVGIALWCVLWITWVVHLLLLRTRLLQRGRSTEAGLAAWLVVSAVMILVNSFFDPTLEGPQVGFWLWLVFGLGVAMPVVYSGVVRDRLSMISEPIDSHERGVAGQ